jgi:hypothetical protein
LLTLSSSQFDPNRASAACFWCDRFDDVVGCAARTMTPERRAARRRRRPSVGRTARRGQLLLSLHMRQGSGLLCGACHRAALCADPLARNDGAQSRTQHATACVSASLAFLKSGPWTVRPNYGESTGPHASRMVRPALGAARGRTLGAAAARIAQAEPLRTRGRLLSRGR